MSTPNIPTKEPQIITAGDTIEFIRTISDYPASDGWTLSYVLRGPQTYRTNATTYQTSDYRVALASNTTANYLPGLYSLEAYVTNATARYSVETWFPQVTVRENPAAYTDQAFDNRTFAAKTLAACETAILKLGSRTVQTASVNGQSYSIQQLPALLALRNRMREEVQAQQDAISVAAGLGAKKNVLVRFPGISGGWLPGTGIRTDF
jgi:hypothetical protein